MSLHKYIHEVRKKLPEWRAANPKAHPCAEAEAIAEEVVRLAKQEQKDQLFVKRAQFTSGMPMEYGYTIARLEEEDINVFTEE